MRVTLRVPRAATYEEYLAVESACAHRHEHIEGIIVAMASVSPEHSALADRLGSLFRPRIPKGCRFYSTNQRFWIPGRLRARYADGSIVSGKREHPPHDRQATTNPVVVVEVLLPKSQGDDEGDKRQDFQSLPDLRAYVLVHQDERGVRIYRRTESGDWPPEPEVYADGEAFSLPVLERPVEVGEVFRDILDEDGGSVLR